MADITYPAGTGRGPANADAYVEMTRRRQLYSGILILLFLLMMVAAFQLAEARNAGGFWEGLSLLGQFPGEVISEAWRDRANLPGLLLGFLPSLIETVNIAAVATILGVLAAGFLALLGTRGLARYPRLVPLFRRFTDICRAVPEIVIALVLIYVLGGGPIPAVAAIAIHTAGAMGKLFSEVAENADLKPVEGLQSTGARWGQQMWLGVIPQVAPNWISYALLRFEINVRASAILGFVGEGGIGYDLKIAMHWGQGRYDEVVAIFLLLFATIVLIDQLSNRLRDRIVTGA